MIAVWWICTIILAIIGSLGLAEKLINIKWGKRTWSSLLIVFVVATLAQVFISLAQDRASAADVANIRDFSSIAQLDVLGNPPGMGPGSDLVHNSALTKMLRDMYTVSGNMYVMKRGVEAEQRYLEVVERFPKFPFAYYFLALSLKERGDDKWRIYASEAQRILKITTEFDGHSPNHDEVLTKVSLWLKEKS